MKSYYTKACFNKDKSDMDQNRAPPHTPYASPSCIKCVQVACQYQPVPIDQYSLHPLPFVSQQSMNDWWPQLTASNNYQCVGKPSNRG